MEVGSPEWIEASLAKLEDLEQQRAEHEAALESANDPLTLAQHNNALERLDAEIKTLYAQLEAVADDEEDDEEAESEDDARPVTQGDEEQSSPHAAAASAFAAADEPVESDPIPAVQPASDNPFGSPSPSPGGGFGGGFDAAPTSFDDDDLKPKGGGSKWAFLAVVVVGGLGVGGYFAWQNMQAQKAKEAKPPPAEQITIDAAAVPKDTEEPNAAKGADATVSPTANGLPTKGSSGGGGGGGGGGSNSKKSNGKNTKAIELKGGGDPLGSGDPLG